MKGEEILTINVEELKIDSNKLNVILSKYKGRPNALIPVLQEVQEELGWVPPETIERTAEVLKAFPSEVYGVLTFYAQFYLKPRGRNVIQVCLGTACYTKGAEDILRRIKDDLKIRVGETTEDMKFSLEAVRCLGACGLAPVMAMGHDIYGAVKPKTVKEILKSYS
ncbi:MAG: NADP-reducing hydrogenase subunit HndA [Actinobacteria bacterium]|nr:NADP-reducing hydrogenase subunit HndA [Actinomycetota bacterium]